MTKHTNLKYLFDEVYLMNVYRVTTTQSKMQCISITPEVSFMLLITQHPLLTASQASHFLTLINLYKPFFFKQAF